MARLARGPTTRVVEESTDGSEVAESDNEAREDEEAIVKGLGSDLPDIPSSVESSEEEDDDDDDDDEDEDDEDDDEDQEKGLERGGSPSATQLHQEEKRTRSSPQLLPTPPIVLPRVQPEPRRSPGQLAALANAAAFGGRSSTFDPSVTAENRLPTRIRPSIARLPPTMGQKESAPASGKLKRISRGVPGPQRQTRAMDKDELFDPALNFAAPEVLEPQPSKSERIAPNPEEIPTVSRRTRGMDKVIPISANSAIVDEPLSPRARRYQKRRAKTQSGKTQEVTEETMAQAKTERLVASQNERLDSREPHHEQRQIAPKANDVEPEEARGEPPAPSRKRGRVAKAAEAAIDGEDEVGHAKTPQRPEEDAEERPPQKRQQRTRMGPGASQAPVQKNANKHTRSSKSNDVANSKAKRVPSPEADTRSNREKSESPTIPVEVSQQEDEAAQAEEYTEPVHVSSDEDSEESEVEDDAPVNDQLYGQKAILQEIWHDKKGITAIQKKRKELDLHVTSSFAGDILDRCKSLRAELSQERPDPEDIIPLIEEKVSEIDRVLKVMDLEDRQERRKHLFENIYTFVFPSLLKTFIGIVDNFTVGRANNDREIDSGALRLITEYADLILRFFKRVEKAKYTAPEGLAIKKPVHHRIIVPLRRVYDALRKEELRQQETHERFERLHQRQRRDAQEAERAEAERKQQEEENAKQNEWFDLHNARRLCEPDRTRRRALEERQAPLEYLVPTKPNVDANGRRFDRVDAFKARREQSGEDTPPVDPSPTWTDAQLGALLECIDFYGPSDTKRVSRTQFYRNIFNNYCGHKCTEQRSAHYKLPAPLREFSLFEIAQKAWYIKLSFKHKYPDLAAKTVVF